MKHLRPERKVTESPPLVYYLKLKFIQAILSRVIFTETMKYAIIENVLGSLTSKRLDWDYNLRYLHGIENVNIT